VRQYILCKPFNEADIKGGRLSDSARLIAFCSLELSASSSAKALGAASTHTTPILSNFRSTVYSP